MYEELIKALRNCNYPGCGHYCSHGCIMAKGVATCGLTPLLRKAADALTELQRQLMKSESDNINLTGWLAAECARNTWNSVKEQLPENGRYLTTVREPLFGIVTVDVLRYNCGKWMLDGQPAPCEVLAWMPLPKEAADDGFSEIH